MKPTKSTTKATKNYQSLKTELDTVLDELQHDSIDVDAALKGYERGLELIQQLETYLKTAENHIKQLQADRE